MPERNKHKRSALLCRPADDKENARVIVSRIIRDTRNKFGGSYPELDKARRKEVQSVRKPLANEVEIEELKIKLRRSYQRTDEGE